MPYRGDVFAPTNFYHLYNRAVGGGLLFFNPDNYAYCLRLVKRYQRKYGVGVIAYCLMPNHYHFLLRQETALPLSKFINVLFNAYVQATNRQQGRKGPLFEGRFKHVWVDRERYLVHLCRYIHLNPLKARLVSEVEAWPWSNYLEWAGLRTGTLQDREFVRERFSSSDAYRRFVADYEDETTALSSLERYLWD
jgi:REP element-mobilizing transposase RayT